MNRESEHASFVIERRFPAPVARVFRAFSDPERKRRWFGCHDDWRTVAYELDFRPGGTELNTVERPDGVVHRFAAHYFDIVPDERIVYAYDMHVGPARISVSLVTITFEPVRAGTKMLFTEQVVFLDGHGDLDERREGTELGLSRIEV
jgi:uncharacterized protein YndB with AHSA1/START domain